MLCTQIVFCFDIQNNLCRQHVLSLEFSCTEARISASEKDLPVHYEHKKKEKYGGRNSRSWI